MENKYALVWNELHKDFIKTNIHKYDNWLDEFEPIISKIDTEIIDLGCGASGNNTIYLLERGKKVLSCDFAIEALNVIKNIDGSKTFLFDMLNEFPFEDNERDLIIADLSLHYFKKKDTNRIIANIKRVLKPNGYLFIRLNSTNSTEYKLLIQNHAMEIESNLFFTKNMEKRFFDKKSIKEFFKDFELISLKEENMSRWCDDKIVWKCAFKNIK